ncbi:MAG: DedA family protein [Sphingomonas sp.]|uniref:DedA family protein n=1 Tax=Sphingomonas sp. TaxID=28214 RepID=UPI001ACE2A88|nr:DedA family protein [Sphingomonas sp.]MBN8809563.1 DedA family protein [Sphingomonas sp.]
MTDWFLNNIEQWGYGAIFVWMALENIIPPIPSEVIMGFAGIAVAHGKLDFTGVMIAGTLGSTLGNYFWYWIGRNIPLARLRPFVERNGRWLTVTWSDVERIDDFFFRHGQWLVFVLRFMPFGRSMVSLPAGISTMKRWKFIVWTLAGTTIWNLFLTGAGWYLGANFREAEAWTGPAAVAICVAIAVWYLYRVATWKPRG